ncbi:MAG: DUF1634 domain-containing protein [Lentisphaeria bacterium]
MNSQPQKNHSPYASVRQLRYATLLKYGTRLAFAVMIITYLPYITGIVKPFIPRAELVHCLSKPVSEYIEATNAPTRHWEWLTLMGKGDFMNYAGILILTLLTIGGILTLIPSYLKDRNWVYATIVTLELLVLLLAASGIINIGGH